MPVPNRTGRIAGVCAATFSITIAYRRRFVIVGFGARRSSPTSAVIRPARIARKRSPLIPLPMTLDDEDAINA